MLIFLSAIEFKRQNLVGVKSYFVSFSFVLHNPFCVLSCGLFYSLRPILLFANMDVPTTKMCPDTSTLAKSIMDRREYDISPS
jgi:hypothetical protein